MLYFSLDIETDGPCPGLNSMLSVGLAAFDPSIIDKKEREEPIATFYATITPLPDAKPDPGTMDWWSRNANAYAEATFDPTDPKEVFPSMVKWIQDQGVIPICVAYPAGYDFTFLYYYLMRFAENSPFSFSCFDIKTAASVILKQPYRSATKRAYPQSWFSHHPHTHKAIDDAIEQGVLFLRMMEGKL